MATLDKALRIAVTAHAGQVDKNGAPYIMHPLRVMATVDGDQAKIVAILHDVVEDTAVTLDDLRRDGFAESLLTAIGCVTHGDDETYADYVVRCKGNELARQVKLADLADNWRLDRCLLRTNQAANDLARLHRYVLAHKFLTDQLSEADYRSLMAAHGQVD